MTFHGCMYCGGKDGEHSPGCCMAHSDDAVRMAAENGKLVAPGPDKLNPKDEAGQKKAPLHLLPALALAPVAKVMALGAKKYGMYNWRMIPIGKLTYVAAALRHLFQWLGGETIDPESGESHLAHAVAGLMILLDAEAFGTAKEDRVTINKEAA